MAELMIVTGLIALILLVYGVLVVLAWLFGWDFDE